MERIQVLKEEAGELQAMIAHIQEKINSLVQVHRDLQKKKKLLDQKFLEAKSLNRDVACQHLAAEIFVVNTEITENGGKIKDLQRESYFIGLERKRKLGVLHKLKEEITEQQCKAELKKQIEEKIKKEGLMAALQSIQIESDSTKDPSRSHLSKKKRKKGKKAVVIKIQGNTASEVTLASLEIKDRSSHGEYENESDEDGEYEEEDEDDNEEGDDSFEQDSGEDEDEGGDDDGDGENSDEDDGGEDFNLNESGYNDQILSPFQTLRNDSPFEISDGSIPALGNLAEPSTTTSLNYSRHEDDHSDIFPGFKPDISFVSEASDFDFVHVAGGGLQVAKALKETPRNER